MKKKRRVILGRLLLLVGSTVLTIGLIEGVASMLLSSLPETRALAPASMHETLLLRGRGIPTEPDAYVMYRNRRSHESWHASTNTLGLRNGEVPERPPAGILRVLVLGGSVVWGYTARSNEDTIAAHLQEDLREALGTRPVPGLDGVEVLNAGVAGHVAMQGAVSYATRWRRLAPDVVVSIDGYNEIYGALKTGHLGVNTRFSPDGGAKLTAASGLGAMMGDWVKYRFNRTKTMRYLRERFPATVENLDPPAPLEIRREFEEAVDLLDTLCVDRLFIPVLQPTLLVAGSKVLTDHEQRLVELNDSRVPGQNEYFQEGMAELRRAFAEFVPRPGRFVPLDATPVFQGQRDSMYTDACHLTTAARELLAARIAEVILASLPEAIVDGD